MKLQRKFLYQLLLELCSHYLDYKSSGARLLFRMYRPMGIGIGSKGRCIGRGRVRVGYRGGGELVYILPQGQGGKCKYIPALASSHLGLMCLVVVKTLTIQSVLGQN
jgi:hypothetical protein